ncbi:hypothetical protein GW764_01530 [Candidatus Parcubacteria bacterium]|nr:hypothetical protein [Candidatus Parcubacteria bacterium]
MTFNQEEYNNRTWELLRKYAEAKRSGFLIEALVLFNYMLRNNLLLIINNKLIQNKQAFKDLYLKQETNVLASTAKNIDAIDEDLRKDIDKYFNEFRGAVVHGMLNGEISYEEINSKINTPLDLLERTQEKIIGKITLSSVND